MIFSSFMNDYLIKGGIQKGDKILLHSKMLRQIGNVLNLIKL